VGINGPPDPRRTMKSMSPRTRSDGRRRSNFLGTATTAAALFVLVLVAPGLLALSPSAKTYKAPYTKAKLTLTDPAAALGCAAGKQSTRAYFHKPTGLGGFSSNATGSSCASATTSSASFAGQLQVNLPISAPSTGVHTITAIWLTIAVGSENLTTGRCSPNASAAHASCTQFAEAYVLGHATLLDKTSGTKLSPSNVWPGEVASSFNNTSCGKKSCTTTASGSGSSSFSGTDGWAWYWNSTGLNASHKYVLEMFIYGGVLIQFSTSSATLTGAAANAQLNGATLGNDEDLYDVTVK
jgi:hypothetical protein